MTLSDLDHVHDGSKFSASLFQFLGQDRPHMLTCNLFVVANLLVIFSILQVTNEYKIYEEEMIYWFQ